MYCQKCGERNKDDEKICKKCKSFLVFVGYHFVNFSDQTVGKMILIVGIILLITAIIPFFVLETKELITLERTRLIVSMPLGFLSLVLIITGIIIHYGLKKREGVLEHVYNDYKRLVENANDSIFIIDHEGRFTYLNNSALKLSGYKKEELIGNNFLQVVAPEYREYTIDNFRKREIGQASDRYNIEIITKDGNKKSVELSLRTLEYNGEFMGVEGIAREIK